MEPLQEGIVKTCTNMKRGIKIKGEGFLLADLDEYMEVVKREHFLSVICRGSWQCGTWLLPTLGHLVCSFLPLWGWVLFQQSTGLLQVLCPVCQACADIGDTLGCSAGSKWLLRCSIEPIVTKSVPLHWSAQPHLCWLSWELRDPAHTENPSPNTLCLKNSYTYDKSKSSHFYNHRWMEAGLR